MVNAELAFDHRVCDGGTAGCFLRLMADTIKNPVGARGHVMGLSVGTP